MGMYFRVALRNILKARRRSAFLASALAIVTMLLVILQSLSQGISDGLVDSATSLSAGHVNVSGFYKTSQNDVAPIVIDVKALKEIIEENTDNLDFLIDRQRGWGKIVSATGSVQAGVNGIDIDAEQRLLDIIELANESEYRDGGAESPESGADPSKLNEPDTVVLFAGQARRLEVGVGDLLTIKTETMKGTANTASVTVVAVLKDIGLLSNWSIFVPKQTVLDLYDLKDGVSGAIMLYLDDIDDSEQTMAHLRNVFADEGYEIMDHDPRPFFMKFEQVLGEDWTGQRLDLTIWEDEVSFLTWIITAVDTVSFILVAVLTIIIIIGIMNTMWIAVRERTSEIGTMRAIGMRKGQVLLLFMFEALLLGFVSTSVGALLGAGIALGLDAATIKVPVEAMSVILMSDTLNLSVTVGHVINAILVFTMITGLSAIWPSIRAARLQPVTAIHHID